ncbi:MAG: 2OG-Fe(II) oxygenase [Verrucomicrobiota bacterium]
MANQPMEIEYARGLESLEKALKAVVRPGSFAVAERMMTAMPRLTVEGVGTVSFPVPAAQAEQLVKAARLAPYGRGEETILDTSVRKVWQISPASVSLGGKGWDTAFPAILNGVCAGLGCGAEGVSAELYKLLIYDEGGFFLPHRDTEKAPGMFGTLVISLPSDHGGGDLHVRHAGEERVLSLTTDEPSELVWAAFYADCEHEVKPVTRGHRVCLVYNLIQQRSKSSKNPAPSAPDMAGPALAVAGLIRKVFSAPEAPVKLVWLLEHLYSPAELSFASLKNADAARAVVLGAAAGQTGGVVHLGMASIEETGSAEPDFSYRSRRSRGRGYHRDEDEDGDGDENGDGASLNYEIVEVCDTSAVIDTWRARDGSSPAWTRVPIEEGELLPAGALDGVKPDRDSVSEATGNEGASYERSYHRAVLTLWPADRTVDVLLQAGAESVAPWLEERVRGLAPGAAAERKEAIRLAGKIIARWGEPAHYPYAAYWSGAGTPPDNKRSAMLRALNQLGAAREAATFLLRVVAPKFDGSENEALPGSLSLVSPEAAAQFMTALIQNHTARGFGRIVNLLTLLTQDSPGGAAGGWGKAAVDALCGNLAKLPLPHDPYVFQPAGMRSYWSPKPDGETDISSAVADLLAAAGIFGGTAGLARLAEAMRASPAIFDPLLVVTPALAAVAARASGKTVPPKGAKAKSESKTRPEPPLAPLWRHAAESLLHRSSTPPQPPADWSQPVKDPCLCADCVELSAFAADPVEQIRRFRINAGRRQHLHEAIVRHQLDMTHVTERKGSPQTLVCTKTRRRYELRLAQYQADLAAFATLSRTAPAAGCGDDPLVAALKSAAVPH